MFSYQPLKNCAGIVLFNDYLSLRTIHDILHDVNERSMLIRDKEGFFLGLAYDVRKAYEGQRRKQKPNPTYPEIETRLGFEILWPTLLVQCRQLRESLAFMDHRKSHQMVTYELEYIIEEAIDDQFKDNSAEIKARWEYLSATHPSLENNVYTRVAQFSAWNKQERKKGMVGLLSSLNPMYSSFYPMWIRSGVTNLVSPEEYALWNGREMPDPKW